MKKIIIIVLAVLSGTALGQSNPPPGGAYIFASGLWSAAATTASAYPLTFTPPPIALYCFNTTTNQWIPADSTCFGGGGGGLPSVQVENVFTGAGTINFTHNLNDEYPLYSCFSLSGASAYTAVPVDANNMAITVSAPATILCAFQKTSGLTPNFSFTVSPATSTYNPTMGGTQTPTFAISQSAIGSGSTATYSTTGLAAGMSSSYSPTTITGTGSSTLSVSFPATQTPGLTTFNASATDGTNTHTYPVSLTVSGINTNLVDGWPMNDGSGTSFLAGPPTSNTQTFSSSIGAWGTNAGFPGTSFTFNGTGFSTGTNSTNTNFDGTTPFSVCTWVNPTTVNAQSLVDATWGTNSTGWALLITTLAAGAVTVYIRNSISNQINVWGNSTPVVAGSLNFVCMTYTGSQHASGVVLYVNGIAETPVVLADTLTLSIANNQPVALGAIPYSSAQFLTGTMGYVRIYNAALTPTQISTLYAAGPR